MRLLEKEGSDGPLGVLSGTLGVGCGRIIVCCFGGFLSFGINRIHCCPFLELALPNFSYLILQSLHSVKRSFLLEEENKIGIWLSHRVHLTKIGSPWSLWLSKAMLISWRVAWFRQGSQLASQYHRLHWYLKEKLAHSIVCLDTWSRSWGNNNRGRRWNFRELVFGVIITDKSFDNIRMNFGRTTRISLSFLHTSWIILL